MEELRFTYTFQDYVAANRLAFRHNAWFWVYLTVAVLGVILSIFSAVTGSLVAAIYFFAFATLLPGYLYWFLPMVTKRRFMQQPSLHEEMVLRFDEDHFEINSVAGRSETNVLYRTLNAPQITLFYVNRMNYLMFPRRVFDSDAQYARLQKLGERLVRRNEDSSSTTSKET